MSKCLIAGVFDPFTNGHRNLVTRASKLFDEVVVVVSENISKKPVLDSARRAALASVALQAIKNVKVDRFGGLLADYCSLTGVDCIVKGVRNSSDFAYEHDMFLANRSLCGVETLFLPSDPSLSFVSSSFVKDLLRLGADVSKFVPEEILTEVVKQYAAHDGAKRV